MRKAKNSGRRAKLRQVWPSIANDKMSGAKWIQVEPRKSSNKVKYDQGELEVSRKAQIIAKKRSVELEKNLVEPC